MDEKELRTKLMEKAIAEIHDAVNYVQGVVTMVRAFDDILNE